VLYPSEGGTLRLASLNYQGIAKGNTIKMTSFAGGWVDDDTGVVVVENDTPDTKECTLYDDNIMQCTTFFTEYCGPDNVTSVFDIPCTAGEWLMTYTFETIFALEGSECPEPPKGFCPDGPPGRKLQEEEEEASHPCPILNGKMN
jgi:hypothetical protein